VLDLSRVLAGPWASQLLGDLGAEVIKVEKPGADGKGGDDTRGWGPPWLGDGEGQPTTDAAYFLCTNRNKRSLTVDITRPEGQAIVRELAAQSDVVLENFKVGGLKAYGLDYASLSAINPQAGLLLDHRLRPGRPLRRARRLRLPDPGHGRPDERHRPRRGRGRRRTAEGRRRADRHPDRPVRRQRDTRRAGASREDR
jgi:hypothetical protein